MKLYSLNKWQHKHSEEELSEYMKQKDRDRRR